MNLKTLSAMAFCLILSAQALSLSASEQQADEYLLEATQQEASGSYRKAAKNFMAAHLESDDPVVRMNALYGAARSYRKQGQYGAEFECLNRLLEDHLGQVNFTEIIDRQYEIADSFFNGHRDAAVYWLPWIPDEDRTMEFYEIALKNAPCANESGV